MGVVPFSTTGPHTSVVLTADEFRLDGTAILILNPDLAQFPNAGTDCNASYDLRVGDAYKDHRNETIQALQDDEFIELLPGNAVIIQTEEEVRFPRNLFGQILPRVSLLQKGVANTPSKIDPGYAGHLLITTFNHGKRTERLHRRQPFCSMHLLTVEDGIRPYNKSSKQIGGFLRSRTLQRWRDWLEARQIWITIGIFVFTVISVIVAIFAIVHEGGQPAARALGHGG